MGVILEMRWTLTDGEVSWPYFTKVVFDLFLLIQSNCIQFSAQFSLNGSSYDRIHFAMFDVNKHTPINHFQVSRIVIHRHPCIHHVCLCGLFAH